MRHSFRLTTLASSVLAATAMRVSAQCPPATQQLISSQKYDEARAEADALLKKNPSDDAALHCVGRIYEAQGKSGNAVDWYEKALKVNANNALHHLYLAEALGDEAQKANKLRQPFLARRIKGELERAIALDDTLVDARTGLIQFYLEAPGIMGGSVDKAREQLQIVARQNPLEGHISAAMIARHEKDLVANERELKAALAVAPDTLNTWYSLGAFYENQKRWSDAAALYDRMITEKPHVALAHYMYGRVAALSGVNMERGEREIHAYLAEAKDPPVNNQSAAHLRLGMIYEQQGKKDAARTEYQTSVTLNPKSDAKKRLENLK